MIGGNDSYKDFSLNPVFKPPTIDQKIAAAGFRFIKIRPVSKRAHEKEWNTKNNYSADDQPIQNWLARNHSFEVKDIHYEGFGNYGILCDEDHIVVDLDTPEIIRTYLDAQQSSTPLPRTRIVQSGSGKGMHLIFTTKSSHTVKMDDPVTHENVGHIKSVGGYAVGPTSIHDKTRKPYIVLEDNDVAFVEFDLLLTVFGKYIQKKEPAPIETTRLDKAKYEKFSIDIPIASVAYPENPQDKGAGEIQGAHPVHGSSGGSNFSINTRKNTWHCFPAGTLIQTPEGLRNIEEIRDGEQVFSSTGSPQKVVTTFWRQYDGDIIDIVSPSGTISVTPGHPILVARCPPCRKEYEPYTLCKPSCPRRKKDGKHCCPGAGFPEVKWINSEDLNPDTDFLVYQENLRHNIDFNLTKYRSKKGKYRIKTPDSLELDTDLATILGWYLSEGHVAGKTNINKRLQTQKNRKYTSGENHYPAFSIQFTLSHSEMEEAQLLKKLIRKCLGLSCQIYQYPKRRTTQISCGSTIIARFIKNTFGNGAANKTLGETLFSSSKVLQQILKSCFDGDGHIRPENHGRQYRTISKKLAMEMHLGLLSLGTFSRVYSSPADENRSEIFSVAFPKERKQEFRWKDSQREYLPISSISKRPFSGVVYNLETVDHTYQAPFVVHNCYRCNSGGGPLEWLAVEHDIIRCDEAHKGVLRGDKFREVLEVARRIGYEIEMPKRKAVEKPTIIHSEPIVLDALPEDIPDAHITLIDAFPRLGKTHWAVIQAIKRPTANIITNTHSINEQQIRIFREHRKPGQLAVHLEGKQRSCRNSKNPCQCKNGCPMYPYGEEGAFMVFDALARDVLYDREVLTNDDVPEEMCPYWTIRAAEKIAHFCFTVASNMNVILDRSITILDEDPTISHFYPSSVDLAENTVSAHSSMSKCPLIEKWGGVADWKKYIEKGKRPKGKKTILRMISVLEKIHSVLVMHRDENTGTFNKTETLRALNEIDTFIPEPEDISKVELLDNLRRFEIPDTFSTFAEPLLFPYRKRQFMWQGHHPAVLRMIANEEHRIRDPPEGRMIIIGSTRAEMFANSTGFDTAVIRVKTFPFSSNFLFVVVKPGEKEVYIHSLEKVLREASKVNSLFRYPSLVLVGTQRQQERLIRVLGGISKGSQEENRIGQQWNRQAGTMNVFYQNSVISRGIDVEFYTRLFVHTTSFANPYWTAVAEVAEEEGDEDLAIKALGIIDAITMDETTNSVLRISPVRRDQKTVTKTEIFEDSIPKMVVINEEELWKIKPGVLEGVNMVNTTFDLLQDNLIDILDQTGSLALKTFDLITVNLPHVTDNMTAKEKADAIISLITTAQIDTSWKKNYTGPFLQTIERKVVDQISLKNRERRKAYSSSVIKELCRKNKACTEDLLGNVIPDMIRRGMLREYRSGSITWLEVRPIACGVQDDTKVDFWDVKDSGNNTVMF